MKARDTLFNLPLNFNCSSFFLQFVLFKTLVNNQGLTNMVHLVLIIWTCYYLNICCHVFKLQYIISRFEKSLLYTLNIEFCQITSNAFFTNRLIILWHYQSHRDVTQFIIRPFCLMIIFIFLVATLTKQKGTNISLYIKLNKQTYKFAFECCKHSVYFVHVPKYRVYFYCYQIQNEPNLILTSCLMKNICFTWWTIGCHDRELPFLSILGNNAISALTLLLTFKQGSTHCLLVQTSGNF